MKVSALQTMQSAMTPLATLNSRRAPYRAQWPEGGGEKQSAHLEKVLRTYINAGFREVPRDRPSGSWIITARVLPNLYGPLSIATTGGFEVRDDFVQVG